MNPIDALAPQRKACSKGATEIASCPMLAPARPQSALYRQSLQRGPVLQLKGTHRALWPLLIKLPLPG